MAVNKNFVVKNGLEVNTDLILADANTNRVGIGSTIPSTTLDVIGGIAATDVNVSGVATIVRIVGTSATITYITGTNLNVSGVGTITNLNVTGVGTITNLNVTGGGDIEADSVRTTNLNVTGILTAASADILNFGAIRGTEATITGFSTLGGLAVDQLSVSGIATIPVLDGTTAFNDGVTVVGVVTAAHFDGGGLGVGVADSTGSVVGYGFTMLKFIGAGNTFAVDGSTVDISITGGGGGGGSASIGIGTTVGDAFSGIVTAGNLWYNTGEGRLFIYYQDEDSAQWVDAAPFNVGIITSLSEISFVAGSAAAPSISFGSDSDSGFFSAGTDQPGVTAAGSQVARFNPGGVNVSGVVTATSFSGDGAGLTGVASTDNIQTSTSAKFLSNVNISGITTVGVVTGGTSVSATHFYGDGSALTGIDASSIAFGGDVKAQAVGTGVVVTGVLTATTMSASNAVFDGNVTVGGTITYQDATSIDVIGISTFQQGIQILANGANIAGIVTVGVTTIKSGEIEVVGVITATSFSGDGSALSGISAGIVTSKSVGLSYYFGC